MRRFLAGVLVGILLSVGTGLTAFLLLGSWLAVEDPLRHRGRIALGRSVVQRPTGGGSA